MRITLAQLRSLISEAMTTIDYDAGDRELAQSRQMGGKKWSASKTSGGNLTFTLNDLPEDARGTTKSTDVEAIKSFINSETDFTLERSEINGPSALVEIIPDTESGIDDPPFVDVEVILRKLSGIGYACRHASILWVDHWHVTILLRKKR